MPIVKHTVLHVFVHIALFTALALLIPVVSAYTNNEGSFSGYTNTLTASLLLITVCIVLLYKMKGNVLGVLRSIGGMMFLPGVLAVAFSVLSADRIVSSMGNITGFSVVQPVADFYIYHSVPAVLSVAAVYMAIGGLIYWFGSILDMGY